MSSRILALIDYGSGNLHSVRHALARAAQGVDADIDILVTDNPNILSQAEFIVLPGVGHFADCRSGLFAINGMVEALEDAVLRRKKPFLGICVGMQLLAESGSEGGKTISGLGWMNGHVDRLPAEGGHMQGLKIPHMGWNQLHVTTPSHPVLSKLSPQSYFYFVHSYFITQMQENTIFATTSYGLEIPAIIGHDNIIATQFHPEKSQQAGQHFLQGFLSWPEQGE